MSLMYLDVEAAEKPSYFFYFYFFIFFFLFNSTKVNLCALGTNTYANRSLSNRPIRYPILRAYMSERILQV